MAEYTATFTDDGSGEWSITIPPEATQWDVVALTPVIKGIKTFMKPGVDSAREAEKMWQRRPKF